MEIEPDNTPVAEPVREETAVAVLPEPYPFWGWLDLLIVLGLLVALMLLILVGAKAATMVDPALKTDPVPLFVPIQLAAYLAVYVAFLLLFRFRFDRPVFSSLGWRRTVTDKRLLLIGLGGLALSPVLGGLAWLLHTPEVHIEMLDQLDGHTVVLALFGLMAVTITPIFEELFFRGFLQPLFSRTLGVTGGILLTAVIFGALHASEYKFVWQYVAAISMVGVVLGVVRYRTNSIIPSTLMHACYNSVFVAEMFLQHK